VRVLRWFEDALLVLILTVLVVLSGAQIVARNVFESGMIWADPALRVLVLWVGLVGAMVAARDDRQITVDAVTRLVGERWRLGIRVLTDLFTAVVCVAVAWHSVRLVLEDRAAGLTAFGGIPVWVCEVVLPLAFAVIGLRYLLFAVGHARRLAAGRQDAS
jgi:TRAP-type C4-dicarboxylate transport system permease small subunit